MRFFQQRSNVHIRNVFKLCAVYNAYAACTPPAFASPEAAHMACATLCSQRVPSTWLTCLAVAMLQRSLNPVQEAGGSSWHLYWRGYRLLSASVPRVQKILSTHDAAATSRYAHAARCIARADTLDYAGCNSSDRLLPTAAIGGICRGLRH